MKINYAIEGRFKLIARDAATLEPTRESEWSNNLITDYGLNRIGTGSLMAGIAVGSGNTAPAVTDVALQSQIARSNTQQGTETYPYSTSSPYYSALVRTYRFAEGVAAGNISEVGVIGLYSGSYPLSSRALVKDIAGNPTTITVLANEILDVVYESRVYLQETDSSAGPFEYLGQNYNAIIRAMNAASGNQYGLVRNGAGWSWLATPRNGPIGAITGSPTGTAGSGTTLNPTAYSDNSLKRQYSGTFGLTFGNVAGGIKSISLTDSTGSSKPPLYQIEFDNPLPKTSNETLTLTFEVSWSRRAIP